MDRRETRRLVCNGTNMIIKEINVIVTNFPSVLLGVTSPYPTVEAVINIIYRNSWKGRVPGGREGWRK